MDECTHCTVRGNLKECLKTPCNQHESWMVDELRKALVGRGCHDIFCDLHNRKCVNCPCHLPNALNTPIERIYVCGCDVWPCTCSASAHKRTPNPPSEEIEEIPLTWRNRETFEIMDDSETNTFKKEV